MEQRDFRATGHRGRTMNASAAHERIVRAARKIARRDRQTVATQNGHTRELVGNP